MKQVIGVLAGVVLGGVVLGLYKKFFSGCDGGSSFTHTAWDDEKSAWDMAPCTSKAGEWMAARGYPGWGPNGRKFS